MSLHGQSAAQLFARYMDPRIAEAWPLSTELTVEQRVAVRGAYDEISMHRPDLADEFVWKLAGNIVARIERDVAELRGDR